MPKKPNYKPILAKYNASSLEELLKIQEVIQLCEWTVNIIDIIKAVDPIPAICSCGTQRTVTRSNFLQQKTKSCGCKKLHYIKETSLAKYGVENNRQRKDIVFNVQRNTAEIVQEKLEKMGSSIKIKHETFIDNQTN